MPSFSTCVIGGGAAGISATLALRSAGSMVTCFEIAPIIGGLWNTDNEYQLQTAQKHYDFQHPSHLDRNLAAHPSPIYPSMRCVLPKDLMSFSDHPFPFLTPQFPHHSAVREYLQDFAIRKGVHALTRYNTRVIKVEWIGAPYSEWQETYSKLQSSIGGAGAGGSTIGVQNAVVVSGMGMDRAVVPRNRQNYWKVRTANMITGDVHDWCFDSVVVAAGRHHYPRYPGSSRCGPLEEPQVPLPKLPGQDSFENNGGTVRHSSETKRFRDFKGKTVIVVGNGIGAMEHVGELQRHGAFVLHSMTERGDLAKTRFAPVSANSSISLPSRRALELIKSRVEKINRFNEKKLIRNILHTRNNKSGISLAGFFGSDPKNPDEVNPDSLASQLSMDPALIGRYLPVPTIGGIRGFSNGRDVVVDVDPEQMKNATNDDDNNNEDDADCAWHPSKKRSFPLVQYLEKIQRSSPHTFERLSQKIKFNEETGKMHIHDVDAIIFSTGYYRDFSFFADPEIRDAFEGVTPLSISANKGNKQQEEEEGKTPTKKHKKDDASLLYRDLYMGCMYRKNPTLGVLGLQSELIPPFLMFEAQSRFISQIFSRRAPFPPSEEEMDLIEERLLGSNAQEVLASPEGLGIGASCAYHDGLVRLCGLQNTLPSYYDNVLHERRFRWGGSFILNAVNWIRQFKPHDRKKQHTIISNVV